MTSIMSEAIQALFAKAVLDANQSVPEGLTDWTNGPPERRFAIYRNNVASGLIRALAARFPATERIVGAAFFTRMAQAYIPRHPPQSPLVFEYGDDFADFAAGFEPAAALPYLPDVMRLEAARTKAYHAVDQAPMQPAAFAALSRDHLPDLKFALHGSATVIGSAHPVVTIWAMNTGDAVARRIDEWTGEDALVIRPEQAVRVHRLPVGGGIFVAALRSDAPLGEAVDRTRDVEPSFDLAATLACCIEAGLFTAVTP